MHAVAWAIIAIDSSFRVQVERFYVHDGASPEPGGGYVLTLHTGSAESLIEDGISVRSDKVIVAMQAGAGDVVAYNYADQEFICCNSTTPANGNDGWIENGINDSHYPGGHPMLFEGNLVAQMGEDETHGNSTHNTYFRNWAQGYRVPSWTNAFDGATINDLTGSPATSARSLRLRRSSTPIGNPLSAMFSAIPATARARIVGFTARRAALRSFRSGPD
jgi:hypothetical protein